MAYGSHIDKGLWQKRPRGLGVCSPGMPWPCWQLLPVLLRTPPGQSTLPHVPTSCRSRPRGRARGCLARHGLRGRRGGGTRPPEALECGPPPSGCQLAQWPLVIRVVAGIEHLDARVVLAIERRHRPWASRLGGVVWGVEPQPEMEGMHRPRLGVRIGIRNRAVVEHRCGGLAWRHNEGLLIEAPRKISHPVAMVIRLNIALVPGQAEGSLRDLD